jgi:hypothetical protein
VSEEAMGERDDEWGFEDTSRLTDSDWIKLNKPRKILEEDGQEAFETSLDNLAERDPICALRVYEAFFPHKVLNALKDAMAEAGLSIEDLKEMIAKAEPKATKQ